MCKKPKQTYKQNNKTEVKNNLVLNIFPINDRVT